MRRVLLWMPVVLFAGLFALVWLGVFKPADRTLPSAAVDKALPDFALPALLPTKPGLARTSYGGGKLRVVNVFASWCVPCVAEAPQIARLKDAGVPVDGIAAGDTVTGVTDFLKRHGDPFERIGDDRDRKVQATLGSSGVPETYVIDGRGRIVRHYVSNLQPDQAAEIIALWKASR